MIQQLLKHRIKIGLGLVGLLVVGLLLVLFGDELLHDHLPVVRDKIELLGWWGPAIVLLAFVLLLPVFFSFDVLVFVAVAAYGFWVGLLLTAVGSLLSGALMFLLARTFLRYRIDQYLAHSPKLEAIDRAIGRQGFKLMLLLRMTPVPFTMMSYLQSAARVRFRSYMLAISGILVTKLPVLYIAYIARHLTGHASGVSKSGVAEAISICVGLIAILAAVAMVVRTVRGALKEIAEEQHVDLEI